MKLNVCKEIMSMDLHDKTIASLQPNVSLGRYKQIRLTLKAVQPNSISKTYIAIRFNLLHFWPSVRSFVFAVLSKCFFTVLSGYFLYFTELYGHFRCLNLAKIRETAPLSYYYVYSNNAPPR